MQHRCKRADGLMREDDKIGTKRGRNSRNGKREGKKKRIVRIEGNNPREFCSTSAE